MGGLARTAAGDALRIFSARCWIFVISRLPPTLNAMIGVAPAVSCSTDALAEWLNGC